MFKLFSNTILNIFSSVLAQGTGTITEPDYRIPNPTRFNSLEDLISAAGTLIQPLFLITFGIIILVGSYNLLISRGTPEKIEEARNTFIAGIVGFAIAVLAPTLVNLITGLLGVEGFSF